MAERTKPRTSRPAAQELPSSNKERANETTRAATDPDPGRESCHLPPQMRGPVSVQERVSVQRTELVCVDQVKIVFTLSGWACITCAEDCVSIGPGTIVTIPAGLPSRGHPEGHTRTITIYVHPDYLAAQLRWLPGLHPLVHALQQALHGERRLRWLQLPTQSMKYLSPLLVQMAELPEHIHAEFTLLSIVAEVFAIVGNLTGSPERSAGGSLPRLQRPRHEVVAAISLMRQHLERAWRIEDLAAEVALSASQLRRSFHEQVGVTPSTYLRQLRTERMAELLITTSANVSEAALEAGWPNPSVASRAFTHRYGMNPSRFIPTVRNRSAREYS